MDEDLGRIEIKERPPFLLGLRVYDAEDIEEELIHVNRRLRGLEADNLFFWILALGVLAAVSVAAYYRRKAAL